MSTDRNIEDFPSLFGSSVTISQDRDQEPCSQKKRTIGEYVVDQEIGRGSFATVFKAHHKNSDAERVAVKVVERNRLNKKLLENLALEISILKSIRHDNIVRLYDVHHSEKFVYLIMEYCAGGDLARLLSQVKKDKKKREPQKPQPPFQASGLDEHIVQRLTLHLGSALECLRSHNLIHRDLKPQNLLLTQTDDLNTAVLKIADFGFARYVSGSNLADTLCGSPLYMAPEILRYEKYDAKADLWSVGAIMYEMLFGKPPFRAQNHLQLLRKIDSTPISEILPVPTASGGVSHSLPSSLSHRQAIFHTNLTSTCIDLLQGLLRKNPLERIGFEEFFMHPFLRRHKSDTYLAIKTQNIIPIPKRIQKEQEFTGVLSSLPQKHNFGFTEAPVQDQQNNVNHSSASSISSLSSRRRAREPLYGSISSSWQPPMLLGSGGDGARLNINGANTPSSSSARHKRQQSSPPTLTARMPFALSTSKSVHPAANDANRPNYGFHASTSISTTPHWTYYAGDERKHSSVTAITEAMEKDFVIIDKPQTSIQSGINIPARIRATSGEMTPDLSPSGSFVYHSSYPETYFPLSHLTKRISVPIPGYTRPRNYGTPSSIIATTLPSSSHHSKDGEMSSSVTPIHEEQTDSGKG